MRDDELCSYSDLPFGQCAHCRGESLPAGIEPEPLRGVEPSGVRVWPPREPVREPRDTRAHPRTPKPLERCRWTSDRGWLTPEHLRDCDDRDCAGCRPCGRDHCAMRGSCPNHVSYGAGIATCPQCIGRTRTDLTQLEELYALVPEEAIEAGLDSEAINLIGPAASSEQLAARRTWTRDLDEARGWCDFPQLVNIYGHDDQHHPYAVLGRWEMALRETYGPQTDLFVTISRSCEYLRGLLAGTFPHGDEFSDFAREISSCRAHLEEVIHDSRRPETGAPCPKCTIALRRTGGERRAARLIKHYDQRDKSGAADKWVCPDNDEHWWNEADYRLWVADDYLANATRLTAEQMAKAHGIKPGTLTGWAAKGKVRKRGTDHHGRLLYDVGDALVAHGA